MRIRADICEGPLVADPRLHVEGAGAILCFEGLVRPLENGEPIEALVYEVYEPMAQQMLEDLALQAIRRFGVLAVHVAHSRGSVAAGMCSFRLCIGSSHRAEGLEAMTWFIDTMKKDVPIWKRPVQQREVVAR